MYTITMHHLALNELAQKVLVPPEPTVYLIALPLDIVQQRPEIEKYLLP